MGSRQVTHSQVRDIGGFAPAIRQVWVTLRRPDGDPTMAMGAGSGATKATALYFCRSDCAVVFAGPVADSGIPLRTLVREPTERLPGQYACAS